MNDPNKARLVPFVSFCGASPSPAVRPATTLPFGATARLLRYLSLALALATPGCSKDSTATQLVCVAGQQRCAGNNAIEVCAPNGLSWLPSGTCAVGQYCSAGACLAQQPGCGDGTCVAGETCQSCTADCGVCCGNGSCEPHHGEDATRCAVDCYMTPPPDARVPSPDAFPPPDVGVPPPQTCASLVVAKKQSLNASVYLSSMVTTPVGDLLAGGSGDQGKAAAYRYNGSNWIDDSAAVAVMTYGIKYLAGASGKLFAVSGPSGVLSGVDEVYQRVGLAWQKLATPAGFGGNVLGAATESAGALYVGGFAPNSSTKPNLIRFSGGLWNTLDHSAAASGTYPIAMWRNAVGSVEALFGGNSSDVRVHPLSASGVGSYWTAYPASGVTRCAASASRTVCADDFGKAYLLSTSAPTETVDLRGAGDTWTNGAGSPPVVGANDRVFIPVLSNRSAADYAVVAVIEPGSNAAVLHEVSSYLDLRHLSLWAGSPGELWLYVRTESSATLQQLKCQ